MNRNDPPYPEEIDTGLTRLSHEFYAVRTTFFARMFLPGIHSYIMVNSDPQGLILFDTGGPGSGPAICRAIRTIGYSPDDILAITISHWHGDHTGGLAGIIREISPSRYPVKIYAGEKDIPLMRKRIPHKLFLHPGIRVPFPHLPGKMPPGDSVQFVPLAHDHSSNPLSQWGLDYIPTPGHTPGHTSYMHTPTKTLLPGCGISLFGGNTAGLVPVFSNRKDQVNSGKMLAELDYRHLYPVHLSFTTRDVSIDRRRPFKTRKRLQIMLTGTRPLFRISKDL